MSATRRFASSLSCSLVIASLGAGCAARGPAGAPATATTEPPIAAQPAAVPAEPIAAATPSYPDCPSDPFCGDHCTNLPYVPGVDCKTTPYGPAKADVVVAQTNLLMCTGGTYALCAVSGPPERTGTNPANNPLPCVLGSDGTADCTCQTYTYKSGVPWFVDINAILNLGAWYQAMQECGPTGASCLNIAACGSDGSKCDGKTKLKVPSICAYIQNQGHGDPKGWLLPEAQLISAFSSAMADDYPMSPPTSCTDIPSLYAGCMTAPCVYPPGAPQPPPDGTRVSCRCPTYRGPYQIAESGQSCSAGTGFVWSGSYTPSGGS